MFLLRKMKHYPCIEMYTYTSDFQFYKGNKLYLYWYVYTLVFNNFTKGTNCINRCKHTPLIFNNFIKGISFIDSLFWFLDDEAILKWSLLLKERICYGLNFFLSD